MTKPKNNLEKRFCRLFPAPNTLWTEANLRSRQKRQKYWKIEPVRSMDLICLRNGVFNPAGGH
jgi:hypothetical protein